MEVTNRTNKKVITDIVDLCIKHNFYIGSVIFALAYSYVTKEQWKRILKKSISCFDNKRPTVTRQNFNIAVERERGGKTYANQLIYYQYENNKLICFAILERVTAMKAHVLQFILVDSNHRNKGIGKNMMNEIISFCDKSSEIAQKLGLPKANLFLQTDQKDYFTKFGFVEITLDSKFNKVKGNIWMKYMK